MYIGAGACTWSDRQWDDRLARGDALIGGLGFTWGTIRAQAQCVG